jgi:hypothetical protein
VLIDAVDKGAVEVECGLRARHWQFPTRSDWS